MAARPGALGSTGSDIPDLVLGWDGLGVLGSTGSDIPALVLGWECWDPLDPSILDLTLCWDLLGCAAHSFGMSWRLTGSEHPRPDFVLGFSGVCWELGINWI